MRIFSVLLPTIVIAGLAASTASAEFKPEGARKADAQTVASFFVGKSHKWKACKGGIYYGANFEAQAWCNRKGPSVGLGKWTVSKSGTICHELAWYWPQGGGYGTKPAEVTNEQCNEAVVAPDGTLLIRWLGEPDKADGWWRPGKSNSIVKGNAFKNKINRLRRKMGV